MWGEAGEDRRTFRLEARLGICPGRKCSPASVEPLVQDELKTPHGLPDSLCATDIALDHLTPSNSDICVLPALALAVFSCAG